MEIEVESKIGRGEELRNEQNDPSHPTTRTETNSEEKKGTKKGNKENGKKVPFIKLFSFADSTDYVLMIIGSIGAIVNGFALPAMTILFGDLIDAFGKSAQTADMIRQVSQVSLKFVYLAVGSGVASFFQVTFWMVTGERQAARIRNLYLKSILRQDIAYFDLEANTGEIIERMSGDTFLIQDAMGEKVGKFIQLIATFIGGFVVAFFQGWLLTLVLLSSIPPLAISGAALAIVLTRLASRGQSAYAGAAITVEQTIGSIRTVASFTGERKAIDKYNKSLNKAYKSGVQEGLATGLGLGSVFFIIFCSYALAMWYGGKMIVKKGYSGGDVLTVIFAVLTGSFSLGQASPCTTAFAAGSSAACKMFEIIKRKPQIDISDMSGKKLEDIKGNIELRDVHFSYPSRPDEKIFIGFSLYIPYGTTTALVGESGSGKSTVISLIERFYDPQLGEVLIDGVNIKEFQLKWIRGKIGLVSQEPVLFASSIKDNILYGKDSATLDEIRVAAELANAAKFIDKMPQGYDTMVGEHGTQLSGGQKQRIAIARAILKDPRILLLDEATSALDAESERVVQEALDRVMVNRTTVIIAHRLSTVRNSDMIAVVHRGSIIEKGSPSKLMQNPDGAYCQLIRLQETNQKSDYQNGEDSFSDIGKAPSQRSSFRRSISRNSSGIVHSGHHSFTASFGVRNNVNIEENVPPESKKPKVPIRRLFSLNKPEIPVIFLGVISAVVTGAVLPVFGIILSNAIKSFYKDSHGILKDTSFWALMFVVLGSISLVATPARTYFFAVAGCQLVRRIRTMTFEKVIHMEISWFDDPENSSGSIGARLSVDASRVRSLVGDALGLLVQNVSTAIIGLAIAFEASWQLALVVLGVMPLIGLNGWAQIKFIQGFSENSKSMYEEASQVASDAVGSIRTVASFGAEEKVLKFYENKCEAPLNIGKKQGIISGTGFGISFFLLFCSYAICFYVGALLVKSEKTSFPEVFRVFFALTMAAIGISQSSSFAPDSSNASESTTSVFGLLERESKIDPSSKSGDKLPEVQGNIEFRHVSFRYPSRPDVQIFTDFCLSIRAGKTVALVGESGSGKSTAISLLQRFYDPDSGCITLDGNDITKLNVRWLRQQMGLVSQEPVLFNETIRENIAYGKEDKATEGEILAAAESANAHKFISGLHQGYDTIVGERGIQLSGGQKQRVAIARAIVKEPKILLLDEATSALDSESERVVQEALDRVMVNRTTVIVAHRLSTIRGADLIGVVKNGVIVEKGTHETLIAIKGGFYSSLIALHSNASL